MLKSSLTSGQEACERAPGGGEGIPALSLLDELHHLGPEHQLGPLKLAPA